MNYKLKTQTITLIRTSDNIYIYRILNNFSAKEIGSLRNSFKHTHTHTHTHRKTTFLPAPYHPLALIKSTKIRKIS
jgi:hypothetical protein